MPKLVELKDYFEDIVGQKTDNNIPDLTIFEDGNELGYSQFNEILSLLGFNRVNQSFFQFLINGETEYKAGTSFKNECDLKEGVTRFFVIALLWYGNIKFAFKILSEDVQELIDKTYETEPYSLDFFIKRHKPINEIKLIPKDKTYLLGYISGDKINAKLEIDPDNDKYKALINERTELIELGKENQSSYLTSDHLDIYIATSMRLEHEFIHVHEMVNKIFEYDFLKELNLRYFDPTQAYCESRIDKGLSEALMLKRAKCTVYFVQETDTLGKDSELASTLAQGKPVIAFIPKGDTDYVDNLLHALMMINDGEKSESEIILEQLKVFSTDSPWNKKNNFIREWIENVDSADISDMKKVLYKIVKERYNNRAEILKEFHPLGIQVNLSSGVANGVLVTRTPEECARLIRSIVLNDMAFKVDRVNNDGFEYLYLKEKISKCIFRLQSGDKLLTNAFWNFYL